MKLSGVIENTDTIYMRCSEAVEEEVKLNDIGNAERLIIYFGHKIRYNYTNEWWHIWDGKRWKIDAEHEMEHLAKKLPELIVTEASFLTQDEKQTKFYKWAAETSKSWIRGYAIRDARSDPRVKLPQSAFDTDKYLINLNNGTYNLREMRLVKHDPNYLLTKLSPVNYNSKAECPIWDAFLAKIFNGNQNLIDFLARSVGYSLTGSVGERCFWVFYGGGHNGKSTFLNVIQHLLGDYAKTTSIDTFLQKKNDDIGDGLAALESKRFVTASEPERRKRLNEALIKQITGGDQVSVRFLYKNKFEYYPQYKIFFNVNHKPIIYEQTEAIWGRVVLVPFTHTILKNERKPDYHLKIIEHELPGVLNWALKGLEDYWDIGLRYPEEVINETNKYRREDDLVGQFIDARCNIDTVKSTKGKDLYNGFENWCKQSGEEPVSNRIFASTLRERGFEDKRKADGKYWNNIELTQIFENYENESM